MDKQRPVGQGKAQRGARSQSRGQPDSANTHASSRMSGRDTDTGASRAPHARQASSDGGNVGIPGSWPTTPGKDSRYFSGKANQGADQEQRLSQQQSQKEGNSGPTPIPRPIAKSPSSYRAASASSPFITGQSNFSAGQKRDSEGRERREEIPSTQGRPTRSTSYTEPLPLFAAEPNLRRRQPQPSASSGFPGSTVADPAVLATGPSPLTRQNLRSHLESLEFADPASRTQSITHNLVPQPAEFALKISNPNTDSRRPKPVRKGAAAPPPPPQAQAQAARVTRAGTGVAFPPAPPSLPFAPRPSTGAKPLSMPKSKSPQKHDKGKEKKKVKQNIQSDPDTHPLNLPPDQLRHYLAQMAREEAEAGRQSMSMDRDTPETGADFSMPNGTGSSSPATPSRDAPGAFPDQAQHDATNGTGDHDERSPTPPPHRAQPPKVDPEACKAAGNKFFKAKDYEKAIAEYTKAVDAEPSNPTYLSNRAAAYISANKYSQALGDSLQASRLDPKNDKILHRLARIYTSLGRPQDALDTYAKIPNASATDTGAARKALQCIEMAEKQINADDGSGNMALWSIDQAKQTLGTGTPTPRRWQILRAKANLKIGSANALGEVQGICQNLMRENPMDAEAIVLAGRAFYLKDDKPPSGKSDYDRAEEYFRQALALDPDNADARNSLRTMKKLDRARTAANDLFKRGKYSDAVTAYTEALTIDSANKVTNAKILGNRAMSRIKIKEYDEAKLDCDQALKLDPTYTKAKKTRAKATGESGNWEQAVKDLKEMAEESPSDADMAKELRNAELELKKSKRKDWYKILGVDKDAGDKDIERAYKRKAAVLHPDKTMGDKAKEEEFKDCLEAKETLLDPQKRHMYDTGADMMEPGMGGGFPGGMGGFGGMGGMGGGVQIDPEMLFNMMNGMGGAGGAGGGGGGFRFSTAGGGGRGGYGSPFG